VPDEVDVKSIRQSLGLTQPERSARVLLIVIAREPEAVRWVVLE